LITKPTGATLAEAKAVLEEKVLDGRKLSAMRFWGLMTDQGEKSRLTERGRLVARDKGARRAEALKQVVASVRPYAATIERIVHQGVESASATDVATYWHEHFSQECETDSDRILNDQAVAFFQIAEGADLGTLIVGRRGAPTRFEFHAENARAFVEGYDEGTEPGAASHAADAEAEAETEGAAEREELPASPSTFRTPDKSERGNRVFITHGKNKKILEQVKELVAFGKFEPVVAQERETSAKPVPDKVMDEMRACQAAVIHVGADGVLLDKDGKSHTQINGNVLIEIGAAMALYGRNFILLVEDGITLPSNLQGLYECRYTGDELSMTATMKLLKGFNDFK
jgi:predicted nucleotide-binding protein